MVLDTDEGNAAATDFDLLAQVAQHKTTFFRSGWASYDTARPGSPRLMPNEARIKDLRADYRAMAPMTFDENRLRSTIYLRISRRSKKPSIDRLQSVGEDRLLARYGPSTYAL